MAIIEESIDVVAPVDRVFAVSQDYAVRYDWDPFPRHIELLDVADAARPGARTLIVGRNGLSMIVDVVQVRPPEVAAIVLSKGPRIFRRFAGSWIFKPKHAGTLVRFRYLVRLRWRRVPAISERIAASIFRRDVRARLLGLKHYCESRS